ncbi:macrophage mannose receptor 1-like [Puntigrus tetrazona]|uniref:macrophage mannose receptor 1-like n=1 Tax=Puntigrus tetrazona TaxID=1606681 RepID=UPI001C8A4B47|nr:macrophage mannose receptor 1-like [Puntigrus tetrazona]
MSWPDAQSYCRERFTDLATVDSMDDVNKLVNIIDDGYSGSVWIGLKKRTQKRWVWSSGENTTSQYYNWASGQPNWNGDCVATYLGAWYDISCDFMRYFVCYGEYPVLLHLGISILIGGKPEHRVYLHFSIENSGYILVQSAKIWSDAQSYCRQHYTDLATIHNSDELDQINQILLSGYVIWIGLFLDSWGWSDQWDLSFRHWAAGQTSQTSGDCVGMTRTNSGRWSQYSCDLEQPLICYGDDKLIKKQIIRLKLSCNGKCTLSDLSLQTPILNEISEKLKSMGLEGDSKIIWRNEEGDKVFL